MSGGLDSAALLARYVGQGYEVWPVYVSCGLRWERSELKWAKKFLSQIRQQRLHKLTVIKLNLENAYDRNWSRKGEIPGQGSADAAVFLPARNLLLVTKSLLFLYSVGVRALALATLKGNPFKDARRGYFKSLGQLLSASFDQPVSIHTPFSRMTKSEIIRRYRRFPIHYSLSCLAPRHGRHCGRCNKCEERRKAFRAAEIPDKTSYAWA